MPRRNPFSVALLLGALASCRSVAAQPSPCPQIDTSAGWARISRAWSNETGLRWSNDSLRRVLLSLRDRDQAPRAEFGARVGDTLYARRLISLDSALTAEMDVVLERFGLPTRALVGAAGSDAAMLIVQHSAALQERVLALAKAVPTGEISAEKLAMLEDRVLVHKGEPQKFGTQFTSSSDGVFRFSPVSDAASLDARRAAAGMPPMRDYVCMMEDAGMRIDRNSLPAAFRGASLDTAAILASARPEIDAANAAWFPAFQRRDAVAVAAAYADSGLFVAGDGTVTRGRAAVARMYAARFTRLRPIRAGAVVQDGLTVLGPTRIAEWGHGWLELAPERDGAPPPRSVGTYLTVWQREADGHWRIVRNLAF